MKTAPLFFAALAMAVASNAFAAGDHTNSHDHQPLHGGIVVEAHDMDYELIAKADTITLHLRDHGKPAKTDGVSAKLTLLNGTEKSEAVLASVGEGKLEAQGRFKIAPGTKVVAMVTMPGKKAANVRFVVK